MEKKLKPLEFHPMYDLDENHFHAKVDVLKLEYQYRISSLGHIRYCEFSSSINSQWFTWEGSVESLKIHLNENYKKAIDSLFE